jgi:uncharacterized protein with HEPN domain
MGNDTLKFLYDIRESALAVKSFAEGKTFDEYDGDDLLQSGIERKFEIIGEALNRIKIVDPSLLDKIREHRSIISFRNILIHGYNSISNRIVWDVIQEDLENLIDDVTNLITSMD